MYAVPMGLLFTWMTYQSAGSVMRGDLTVTLVMLAIPWTIAIAIGVAIAVAYQGGVGRLLAKGGGGVVSASFQCRKPSLVTCGE